MDDKVFAPKGITDKKSKTGISRRNFFRFAGGGVFIFFSTWYPGKLLALQTASREEAPPDFNAFLRINEDGTVSGFTGKIEMGQGIVTSLTQMLAEEMDVTYDDVDLIMGDTDLCPWDMVMHCRKRYCLQEEKFIMTTSIPMNCPAFPRCQKLKQ
jgi:hypothetical protein